ncbi:MAG: flavin monoamine oxidase family protein [Stellaceae bacterium]
MLDFAIVGGGLCGLALAYRLQGRRKAFALFEARPRFGGRILSVPCTLSDMHVDLGPTWFWPQTQPAMAGLAAELGLASFPQYDTGAVLVLRDPDKGPERLQGEPAHAGAQRIEGGMGAVIDALLARLPSSSLYPGHVLAEIADRGGYVELRFHRGAERVAVLARRVVLAMPPRLLEEHVRFEPQLDEPIRAAMRKTPTWMATQAKIVITYDRPPSWHEIGNSGNAFVYHEQAVLSEIFDACDGVCDKAALGGFLALSPDQRESFRVGLPMLMASQMAQLFGPEFEHGEQHYQDWAGEGYTCARLDRSASQPQPPYGDPLLQQSLWSNKLFLGGSETARDGGGYLEGALGAALRIERQLADDPELAPREPLNPAALDRADAASLNSASLSRFHDWVASRRGAVFEDYRQHLNEALASQQRDQLTQRAMLAAMEHLFKQALDELDALPFDMSAMAVERGRSALTPKVQASFAGFIQALLDAVIDFNRTSCALSNFPDEHHLSKEYVGTTLRDIAAAWRDFSLSANRVLLGKAVPPGETGGAAIAASAVLLER